MALKKAHNIPVYHPAREEDLISKLRSQAAAAGINTDFMEEMYRVILRNSRMEQTVEMKQQGVRAGATVLIVGGAGQMGRFFCRSVPNFGLYCQDSQRRELARGERAVQKCRSCSALCPHSRHP